MILNDNVLKYTGEQGRQLAEQIKEIFEMYKETSERLTPLLQPKKFKQVAGTDLPNDYHINPHILAEFAKLKDEKLTLPEVLSIYERWLDGFYTLVVVNEPLIPLSKKLRKHILDVQAACTSFQTILDEIRRQTASTKTST